VSGLAAGWFLQGPEISLGFFIPAGLTVVLTACVAAGGVFLDFLERMQDRAWAERLNPVAKLGFVLLLGEIVSILSYCDIHDRLLTSARRWSVEQTALIERWREIHGRYPSDLADVADVAEGPRLLRVGDLRYGANDDEYWFELSTGLMGLWQWSSSERVWRFDD
jgi:hypothetical protein